MKDSVVRLWGLALCLVLSGCSALHVAERKVRNMEEPAASPALDRMHDVRSRYGGRLSHGLVTQPERVTLDDADDWLRFAVGKGGFETAPLPVAVDMLVGRRPMRFSPGMEALLVSEPVSVQTVQEALDALALQADVAYEMADGVLTWRYVAFKSLPVKVSMASRSGSLTAQNLNAGESGGRGGGGGDRGGGEGSGSDNTITASVTPVEDLVAAVESAMHGDEAAEASFSMASNALNVRGRPSSVRAAEAVVDAFNKAAGRRVILDLTYYDVDVTDTRERSLDLKALRNGISGLGPLADVGLSFTGTQNFGASDTSSDAQSQISLNFDGDWDESSVVLRWLNTIGETEISHRQNVQTGNGQMVSVERVIQQKYVSKTSRETQSQGNTTDNSLNIETASADSGVVTHILPTIVRDGVNVQMAVSIGEVLSLETVDLGVGASARLPTVASTNQLLNFTLRSGETRLVANLGRRIVRRGAKRLPWLPILGRSQAASARDIETVLLVTAVVLDS